MGKAGKTRTNRWAGLAAAFNLVAQLEFFIDGARLGERTTRPCRMPWNAAPVKPETWRQLTAVACDRAGHRSEARQKVRVAGMGRSVYCQIRWTPY